MPYVICPSCSLSAYSAARFSTVDECARCGTELSRGDASASRAAPPLRALAAPARRPPLRVVPGGAAARAA